MAKSLRERVAELGMKAVAKVFEDPRRAEAIAGAIGALQKAKAALDETQEKALRAAGLVTRKDFKAADAVAAEYSRLEVVRRVLARRQLECRGPWFVRQSQVIAGVPRGHERLELVPLALFKIPECRQLRQTETARRWLKRTATGPPQTVQPPSTSISRRVSCAGLGAFIAFR